MKPRTKNIKKLLEKLGFNTLKIQEKYNEIGAVGASEGLKPSLVNKVTRWLEQIAGLQEKEKNIINEIKAIEEKHKELRRKKKLRVAAPAPEEKDFDGKEDKEENPRSKLWLWLLFFWFMMSRGRADRPEPRNG